ncbi:MAG: L-2-hydroxyglutarate oxidase [Acidobacteriota bacterium]|nr:L-2-hydroxyglutarate oxidase [Acidobacteriota bacterium]
MAAGSRTSTSRYDFAVVGGGIVGLATAWQLGERYPEARLLLLEKEQTLAHHQTGRNSGVIHSGIYYKPGSFKARFARAGNRSMVEFCRQHDIEHEICGKVIVATEPEELPLLNNLYERGRANELEVTRITPEELKEIEPHARGLAALHVHSAGIVNYKQVAQTFARLIIERGGDIRLGTKVERITEMSGGAALATNAGTFETGFLVNCTGLHSDRVARLNRVRTGMKIVPFRGEYYELREGRRHLVKHLIYPVPNPDFPFLGVHFTRMIGGGIHCGPNAVLSLKREGYQKTSFNLRDFFDIMTYPAFWKLAGRHWNEGAKELVRSFSKAAFVRSLRRLIPAVESSDLVPSGAGVRAQALMSDGKLMDDFLLLPGRNSIHVCNAPSPAATASIQIGSAIAGQIPAPQHWTLRN